MDALRRGIAVGMLARNAPEMRAGARWLYACNPDATDGLDTLRDIIRAAWGGISLSPKAASARDRS